MTARTAPEARTAPPAPNGEALVVADSAAATRLLQALEQIGYRSSVVADPYSAAVELVGRPLAFRAIVLSLSAMYPEELRLIELIKGRFEHVEVVLADTEGRAEAVEEATRRGADAILGEDRLQRLGPPPGMPAGPPAGRPPRGIDAATIEGVLSADEIKALLE